MNTKKDLTKEILHELCYEGFSDRAIGERFGMTGEGVAYRRKKYGISTEDKPSATKEAKNHLKSFPVEILEKDYYSLTTKAFSEKYRLSKTVWLPYLRELGILDKETKRRLSYPDLSKEQQSLLVGSLLGDGGITKSLSFYESHSLKQELYLRRKYQILKPFSTRIRPCDENTGLRMSTVSHAVFGPYRRLFYDESNEGKHIPVDFIMSQWGDLSLAVWFFDDGCIDDITGEITIANKCPVRKQLEDLTVRLNERYNWGIHCGTQGSLHRLYFPRSCRKEMGDILFRYATPDVYYKVPEESLSKNITIVESGPLVHPKLYRAYPDLKKKEIEQNLFLHYRAKGFPYSNLSKEMIDYYAKSFFERKPKESEGVIEHNTSGLALCEYFFPNLYDCRRMNFSSPRELWDSDDFLRKLVINRLRYSDRINDASMRRGIKLSKYCVSNFKPMIALYLYKKYADGRPVYDYSAGFGARMLAAMSLGLRYVACEPSTPTRDNLKRFGLYLRSNVGGDFEILSKGSEEYSEGTFHFAFSSPPYFDFEWYSDDPGQSVFKYPDYSVWLQEYWRKTICNVYTMLDSDGHFGVCLSPYYRKGILETTVSIAEEEGFYFLEDYKCPFKQVLTKEHKYEIVLIFSKKRPNYSRKPYFSLGFLNKPVCKDGFQKDLKKYRKIYTEDEYEKALDVFRCGLITSRETYKKSGINGIPVHVLEHRYGSWNAFVEAAGLKPEYVAKLPVERISEYFEACLENGQILSFMEYEKKTGNPCTRLKRLFNKGKPYHHLKQKLFESALDINKQNAFLRDISRIS